jgi:hypothetical protein
VNLLELLFIHVAFLWSLKPVYKTCSFYNSHKLFLDVGMLIHGGKKKSSTLT